MKKESGFTLLELMIVMVLVALIMALAAVFFANTLPSSKFNATVRELITTIRYARSAAQTQGQDQTVTIDLDSKRYGIEGRGEKTIPADVFIKVIDTASQQEITNGKCELVFRTIGGAEGGTVVLWNRKKLVSITLDPIVGSVLTKSQYGQY